MTEARNVPNETDDWEGGALGRDEQSARLATTEETAAIDADLGLQAISIRLPKTLIESFKIIAQHHGMRYQSLMREALARFAEGEFKIIATAAINATQHEREVQHARKAA